MKTLLFYLGHPAHWHNVKNVCAGLSEKGHHIILVAREKDVLTQLLEGLDHTIEILPARKKKSRIGTVLNLLAREKKMLTLVRKYRPDIMIGTDPVITHIGKLLNIPSVVLNEDDADAVPLFAKYTFPFCTVALAPKSCNTGRYANKHIQYPGYHELAYLHPNHFSPDRDLVNGLIGSDGEHFLIRSAALTAHHDKGRKGIDDELALELIKILEPHGKVIITSERPLSPALESYRMQFHPKHMHHVLAFAKMYIGDSQTMTAEAALLGVPSIRFNDFVGELGYLEELEHRFGLTKGIRTDDPELLVRTVKEFLRDDVRQKLRSGRNNMLKEMIDVAVFFEWFIENFPESRERCLNDKQLWKTFSGLKDADLP